jgi:hypothetical protein
VEDIKRFFSTIWEYWKKVGEFIGNMVGRVFLMVFYISVVLPFGVGTRLLGDPLDIRRKQQASAWKNRTSPEPTIKAGYNQF